MAVDTQTKTTVPWIDQQPFLKTGWAEAQRLLQQGMPNYYGHKATAADVAAGKAKNVGDWVYNKTVADFAEPQKWAQKGIMSYLRSQGVKDMQKEAGDQLSGTYDLANTLAQTAQDYGADAVSDAETRAKAIGKYGTGLMDYGDTATQYDLTQKDYAGMTPFQEAQLSGMLAGDVNVDSLKAVTEAMGRDISGAMSAPGGLLAQIRQQQVGYQPGGSSRGDLVAATAAQTATQKLTDQASRMYADAFAKAQDRRLPAGQMALQAQQTAQQFGLSGGQLGLGAGDLAQKGYGTGLSGTQAAVGAGGMGLQAMSQYPSIMQAPLGMYQAGSAVGAQQRALQQARINADMKQYNYTAMKPYQALASYMPMISGDYGSQSKTNPSALQNMGSITSILGGLAGIFGGS